MLYYVCRTLLVAFYFEKEYFSLFLTGHGPRVMSSPTKMGGGLWYYIFQYLRLHNMLYFQNPRRYELQFGIILKLKLLGNTLESFTEIAYIRGKFQPIKSCQARVVEMAVPEVAVPLCTQSMGNSDFWLFSLLNHHIFATTEATNMVLVLLYS